jgi:hypothetical protein
MPMLTFARNRASALAEGVLLAVIAAMILGLVGINLSRASAATSYTTPEGAVITIDSASWTGTADDIYRMLLENGMDSVVGPKLTVKVQDVYASATTAGASCCTSSGGYYNFTTTIWLDGRTTSNFTSRPDYVLGHEFGHAWTLEHLYMDQSADWAAYLAFRGIANDPRLETTYAWSKREMIADDYRLIMGSPQARVGAYINPDVAPPGSIPGFVTWFRNTWAKGNIGTILSPTPLSPDATPAPPATATPAPTLAPTQAPAATPAATSAPTTPSPTPSPTVTTTPAPPTATPTPVPTPTPPPSPVPPTPQPTPAAATLSIDSLTASPQSFRKSTKIGFTVSETAQLTAVVLDSKGATIKTLLIAQVAAGASSVTWDRTDSNGHRVGNGKYRVQVQASDTHGEVVSAAIDVTAK